MAEGSHMYMGTCADFAQAAKSTISSTAALTVVSRPEIAVMANVPVLAKSTAAPRYRPRAPICVMMRAFMPAFLAVGVM